MLFSHARSRSVVSVSTAETVGTLTGCTVAASPTRIAGFRVKTRGLGGRTLTWENILSFGADAVTVRSAETLEPERHLDSGAPAHKSHDPIGKPVLTERGESRGRVADIDFDAETGRIVRLLTTEQAIPGEQLLGAGDYALVVRDTG